MICGLFDISRRGYNKELQSNRKDLLCEDIILEEVRMIRKDHPRMGGKKLYHIIKPKLEILCINVGRDKFLDILSRNNLLIKNIRKRVQTTYSYHWLRKYRDLIKGKKVTSKNEVWVSDLSYWKIGDKFLYLHFITDMYSKKILGYSLSSNMEVDSIMPSLGMALSSLKEKSHELIHHSDRGSQYCSKEYTDLLKKEGISISMTETGDPLDNAVAERVNGIIKTEYLDYEEVRNITEGRKSLEKAVNLYNNKRPHLSLNYHTPNEVHEGIKKPKRVWKNYYKKPNEEIWNSKEKVVNLC